MVVEVFITHIEISALASIKPPTSDRPLPPAYWSILSAIRRCRFQRCMAKATTKPPRNRNMILFAYGAVVSSIAAISNIGNKAIGSKAVTAIGTASVDHQTAIRTPTQAVAHALRLNSSGPPSNSISSIRPGPRNRPMRWPRDRPAIIVVSLIARCPHRRNVSKATRSSSRRRHFQVNFRHLSKSSGFLAFPYKM